MRQQAPWLLRGALLVRIALGLLARRCVFFLLGLLVLRLVRLTVLVRLGRGACGGESCGESHDFYLLSCRGERHTPTLRASAGITYG